MGVGKNIQSSVFSRKLLILSFVILSLVFTAIAEDTDGLDIEASPENPKVGDNIIIEVYDENDPVEGAEVFSRNNLVGETDENGVLISTPGTSGTLALTVEEGSEWAQTTLEVEGAQVSEASERNLDQSLTGEFTENPSNLYLTGFILGIIAGFVILLHHRNSLRDLKKRFKP